jgi:hypothetical protein
MPSELFLEAIARDIYIHHDVIIDGTSEARCMHLFDPLSSDE